MGLITFALLFAITAVYLNNYIENKPELIKKVIIKINENMELLVKWGSLYATAAAMVSLIALVVFSHESCYLFRFIANAMILVMLAPALFEKYSIKIKEKAGDKALETAGRAVKFLKSQEKYVGYAGAGVCLLIFLAI